MTQTATTTTSPKVALITGVTGQDGAYLSELGGPSKATAKLSCTPKPALPGLVEDMVGAVDEAARRGSLIKLAGFQTSDYDE
jgi:GDP-D-mannose dehydratase